jgi:hypothetical protein
MPSFARRPERLAAHETGGIGSRRGEALGEDDVARIEAQGPAGDAAVHPGRRMPSTMLGIDRRGRERPVEDRAARAELEDRHLAGPPATGVRSRRGCRS